MAQTGDPKAYYGYLFEPNKQPTKVLDALLRGIANYISDSVGDRDDKCLSPAKLATFYKAVGGNYDSLFVDVPHSSISWIYASIGCQHTLQPTNDEFSPPSIPALTTKGFVRWQSIEILLGPEEHVPFLQYAVGNFDIKNPDTGEAFPKELPKEALPLKSDTEIEKWHTTCAEKLRQQATPTDGEKGESQRPNLPPRPKVQTGYAHVRPPQYTARERPEARDYMDAKPKAGSRHIPYQHVSGVGRPGLSREPSHRARQFLDPEAPESPRASRSRRRSYPEPINGSPTVPHKDDSSPNLESSPNDHVRPHSHPRRARQGSCSSDASSEGDSPPSPRNVSYAPSGARSQRPHPPRAGDGPSIRFAYASPTDASPPIPHSSPNPRPRKSEERQREEEAKRKSYPIPIDLSGKLSAPFLLGARDREKPPRISSRGGKVSWKDLSDVQDFLRRGSKSSEDDREKDREPTGRRASRDEREKDSGSGSGRGDYKHRERERERERDKEPIRSRTIPSSREDGSRRDRDRERDSAPRDVDRRSFRNRGDRDRDRDRDTDRDRRVASPPMATDGRYYAPGR